MISSGSTKHGRSGSRLRRTLLLTRSIWEPTGHCTVLLSSACLAHAESVRQSAAAEAVLDARRPHLDAGATLADLYDPLAMPPALVQAHRQLDRAVDRAYRPQPFTTEANRVAFLFDRYEALANPLGM